MRKTTNGFTIVELLIVIIVIAILAAISVVAYRGIQERARDAQRAQDIKTITQALEAYYLDNGMYPYGSCTTNCAINNGWSTTNDGSWTNLANALVPEYLSSLPSDPAPSTGSPLSGDRYGYAYYANQSTYCGAGMGQMYIIVYRFESQSQKDLTVGECPSTSNPLGYYASRSNYRVVKGGS